MLRFTKTREKPALAASRRTGWGWRFVVYALLLSLTSCQSCKKTPEPIPTLECKKCISSTFCRKVKNLKGVVKKVGPADYFYDDGKYYVEVSSVAIPEADQSSPTVRLFPCCTNRYDDSDIGKEVILNVDVFLCGTGDHGRPSNDIYIFYVFN